MFVYFNANPNDERIGDCVIRAMSLALNIDYDTILKLLVNNAKYFNCDLLVKDCYAKLLDDLGYKCYDGRGYTVKEIAEDFFNKKLLLRIDGHLTCAMYGDIFDTWNTSSEMVDCFWIIE